MKRNTCAQQQEKVEQYPLEHGLVAMDSVPNWIDVGRAAMHVPRFLAYWCLFVFEFRDGVPCEIAQYQPATGCGPISE